MDEEIQNVRTKREQYSAATQYHPQTHIATSSAGHEAGQDIPVPMSIWDRIEQIWSDVPVVDRSEMPPDGAAHHDRYIREIR
jgi:hypothetical protein